MLTASIAESEKGVRVGWIGSAFPIAPPPPALLFWRFPEQRQAAEIRDVLPDRSFVQDARTIYPTNPGPGLSEEFPHVLGEATVMARPGLPIRRKTWPPPWNVEDLILVVAVVRKMWLIPRVTTKRMSSREARSQRG